MDTDTGTFTVRDAADGVRVVEVEGDVTPATEASLMGAFARASDGARAVVLDFTRLDYMNSGGIGLLVTLLVRAQRDRLPLHACGLSEHYRQILSLTRLDEAIAIHDSEQDAVAAVGPGS